MARAFAALGVLVGAGLTLGFGYLLVDSALDLYAFPQTPRSMGVAQLAAIEDVPRGTWVRLEKRDLVEIAGPVQPNSGGPRYVLLGDPAQKFKLVVTYEAGLEGSQTAWEGVPTVHSARTTSGRHLPLPHALRFPGVPLARWAEPRVTILWTYSGPNNALMGVVFCPLMVLVGLFVTYYYLQSFPLTSRSNGDAVWASDSLPKSVRLSPRAAKRTWRQGVILGVFACAWLLTFGTFEYLSHGSVARAAAVLSVGLVLLLVAGLALVLARRLSGHDYFAQLVWLTVQRSYSVRARGIDSGVTAYELALPPGASPRTLTAHSGATSPGLVFRNASRSAVLGARPLNSTDIIVLSAMLDEIQESPLSPLTHPRRHLIPL